MHFAGFDEDEAWYARPRAKNPRAGTFRTTRIVHPEFADLIARRRFVRRDHSPTFATRPRPSRRPLHPAGTFAGALACMDENEDIPCDEVDAGVPFKPRAAWSAEEDARLARCARASRAGRSRPLASASPRESRVRFVSLGC